MRELENVVALFAQSRLQEANWDCIRGAIIPIPAETTSIKKEASPAEYQLSCANGVAGAV